MAQSCHAFQVSQHICNSVTKSEQEKTSSNGDPNFHRNSSFRSAPIPVKIHKIHSLEFECRLSLRSKTAASSEAKATAPKANATAKSFLILPLPATRKFSPTPPTPGRSLS